MDETRAWDNIEGFNNNGEYQRFQSFLDANLADETVKEVPVRSRYSDNYLYQERWFSASSTRFWRLVEPDGPFSGLFMRVPKKELETGAWDSRDRTEET